MKCSKLSARVALFTIVLSLLAGVVPGTFVWEAKSETKEARRQRLKQCRELLKSAWSLKAEGLYDEAIARLDSALECDARNPDAYYLKGVILAEKGDTTGALATLQAGITAAPLSSRIKLHLARILIARGEYSSADSLVDGILAIKTHEPQALYLKGLTLLAVGDSAAALERLRAALEGSLTIRGK